MFVLKLFLAKGSWFCFTSIKKIGLILKSIKVDVQNYVKILKLFFHINDLNECARLKNLMIRE